jgi:phage tail sheath protein FI
MPTYLSPGVYVEEVARGARPIEGVGTSVPAFIGLAPKGPLNEPVLVTNWSQYAGSFGDITEDYYLAHSVYGFFNNGGTTCYVLRVGGASTEERSAANGAAPKQPKGLPAGEPVSLGAFSVAAIAPGRGGPVTVEVADAEGEGAADRFRLVVREDGSATETFDVTARRGGRAYVVTQVRERSKLITISEAGPASALARPDNQTVTLAAPPRAPEPSDAVTPAEPGMAEYIGDSADRTGFGGLEAVDEITMVAVPDLMAAYERGAINDEAVRSVQLAMIAHCELMGDRVAIIDSPPGLNARQVEVWRQNTAGYDSQYAALYYPWIKVFDPSSGRTKVVPPSGHVAGIWARNDGERGVHKAPANEVVRGVVDLDLQITRGEQDILNPLGINCIRSFPGRGIRVWGARTLSSDPAWRYLNVRRYFNYLEESILIGTQWAVFEPNDSMLWARIRRNIAAFLTNEWRAGALFGARVEDSFYVKCDEETNPPESVDLGRVICEIGVAPVKPAEFVIFRLAQDSGGGSELRE